MDGGASTREKIRPGGEEKWRAILEGTQVGVIRRGVSRWWISKGRAPLVPSVSFVVVVVVGDPDHFSAARARRMGVIQAATAKARGGEQYFKTVASLLRAEAIGECARC